MARLIALCQIALLTVASTWPAIAQNQQTSAQVEARTNGETTLRLSPEAVQVADEIEVTSLLERLRGVAGTSTRFETLAVRQEVTEKILLASLDVDSVNAIIDAEVEQLRAIRSDLQAQRDKAQNIINIASLITGGALGVVNTALQFNSKTANLGNGIGVAGGTASVVLSVIGIRPQGGRRALGDSSRMLARFFGLQTGTSEAIQSAYPEEVWAYLNSVQPSQPTKGTRREQLIAKWRREGRLTQSPSKSKNNIAGLSGNISQSRKLSISDLDDRVAMLQDVSAQVSLMKRELSEILRSCSTPHSMQELRTAP